MRQEYHKLVRDRIPEIIERDGRKCEIEILSEEEYRQALRQKLVEEAQEAAESSPDHLTTELADLYEIIDALMIAYGLDREAVLAEQNQRRAARGGFDRRIRLLWTD
jgi:predicted house-cleaning noncanonical NTP pyrophosphatase (MazG superfamily)